MVTPTEASPERFDDEESPGEAWEDPDLRNPCPKGTIKATLMKTAHACRMSHLRVVDEQVRISNACK